MPEVRGALMVVWRRQVCCRSRLLRVHLAPDGWRVKGDGYRIHIQDWVAAVDLPETALEDRAKGELFIFDARSVKAVDRTLPLGFDDWEHADFQVGCDHYVTHHSTRELEQDCRRAKTERGRVERRIEPPSPGKSMTREEYDRKTGRVAADPGSPPIT